MWKGSRGHNWRNKFYKLKIYYIIFCKYIALSSLIWTNYISQWNNHNTLLHLSCRNRDTKQMLTLSAPLYAHNCTNWYANIGRRVHSFAIAYLVIQKRRILQYFLHSIAVAASFFGIRLAVCRWPRRRLSWWPLRDAPTYVLASYASIYSWCDVCAYVRTCLV